MLKLWLYVAFFAGDVRKVKQARVQACMPKDDPQRQNRKDTWQEPKAS